MNELGNPAELISLALLYINGLTLNSVVLAGVESIIDLISALKTASWCAAVSLGAVKIETQIHGGYTSSFNNQKYIPDLPAKYAKAALPYAKRQNSYLDFYLFTRRVFAKISRVSRAKYFDLAGTILTTEVTEAQRVHLYLTQSGAPLCASA